MISPRLPLPKFSLDLEAIPCFPSFGKGETMSNFAALPGFYGLVFFHLEPRM